MSGKLLHSLVLSALLCSSATAGATLYGGVGGGSPTNPGALLSLDPETGAGQVIGLTGLSGLSDVELSPSGELYASGSGAVNAGQLFTLDTETAEPNFLGPIGFNVSDIAFASNGTLYGLTAGLSSRLLEIDPVTGSGSVIGFIGTNFSGGGLAFDNEGTLYASINDSGAGVFRLLTLDLETGAGTSVSILNTFLDGLGFSPAGNLFASIGGPDGGFASVDIATGTATFIGDTGVGGLSGISFVPEPATIGLLGLGAMLILRKR